MKRFSIISSIATLLVIFVTRGHAHAAVVATATLEFKRSDDSSIYTMLTTEQVNIEMNEIALQNFLNRLPIVPMTACATGIWRFYPETNFNSLTPAFVGYQIGIHEKYTCFDIGSNGPSLASMKSYRSLGGDNLNQQAIHIYSEEYGGGQVHTFIKDDPPLSNIPTRYFTVKSVLITGQHDDPDPTNPDLTLAPVFKVWWDPDPTGNTGNTLCYILATPNFDHSFNKMHFQVKMNHVVEGIEVPVDVGALQYFSYAQVETDVPRVCPNYREYVRSDGNVSVASFPIIAK